MRANNRFPYRTTLAAAILGFASSAAGSAEAFFPGYDPDLVYFHKAFSGTVASAPAPIGDYDVATLPSEDPSLATFNELFREDAVFSGSHVGSGLTCSDEPTLEYWSRYVPPV